MTRNELNMSGQNLRMENLDIRRGIFRFRHAALGFLLGVFVFPSYFGIYIGFDLTALRFFEILLLVMIYLNKIRRNQFIQLVKECKQNVFIAAYFGIVCYTNILRGFAINGILYTFFNWVVLFYLTYYLIQYEWGIARFVKLLKICLWVVCFLSVLELFVGFPPFSLLDTLGKSNTASRFGTTRIMGQCTTTNGFGLYLMLLMPIAAYDEKKGCINIVKNMWLVLLTVACGLLTGGRVSAGAAVLELGLLWVFSPNGKRGQVATLGGMILVAVFAISVVLQDVPLFRSLLMTFFSAVDEVLGTALSVHFGANMKQLYDSSYYRELLWKGTFLGDWLNPWLGRGAGYNFGMYIEGYRIHSIDNFYVGQYVTYAYPGLAAWLLMSLSFLKEMIRKARDHTSPVCIVILISFVGYFISLWYLDQLQTFPIMMALFALGLENKKICARR